MISRAQRLALRERLTGKSFSLPLDEKGVEETPVVQEEAKKPFSSPWAGDSPSSSSSPLSGGWNEGYKEQEQKAVSEPLNEEAEIKPKSKYKVI